MKILRKPRCRRLASFVTMARRWRNAVVVSHPDPRTYLSWSYLIWCTIVIDHHRSIAIASYTYKLISKHCWHHFVAHPQICSPQRRKTCRRQVQLTSVLLSWRWTRTTKNLTLFLGLYDDDDRYINYNLIKISSWWISVYLPLISDHPHEPFEIENLFACTPTTATSGCWFRARGPQTFSTWPTAGGDPVAWTYGGFASFNGLRTPPESFEEWKGHFEISLLLLQWSLYTA